MPGSMSITPIVPRQRTTSPKSSSSIDLNELTVQYFYVMIYQLFYANSPQLVRDQIMPLSTLGRRLKEPLSLLSTGTYALFQVVIFDKFLRMNSLAARDRVKYLSRALIVCH